MPITFRMGDGRKMADIKSLFIQHGSFSQIKIYTTNKQ
jgi:hypothetical protein